MASANALGCESSYQARPDAFGGLFLLVSRRFQAFTLWNRFAKDGDSGKFVDIFNAEKLE